MMNGGEIIVTTFIGCGMVVGIVWIVAWMIVTLVTGKRNTRILNDNEARVIQEIYHGLSKMEQRVESLETLLLEKERKS